MSENILEINSICINYDEFKLKNVSFNVEKGCILGLVGKNGAGKTTIIKAIMNIEDLEEGSIKVFGKDHIDDEVYVKNYVGYVADEDYLYGTASLIYYANEFVKIYDEWNWDLFYSLVEKWGLPLTKRFSEYSKGMKRLAMFTLALAHNPKLLILDETTAGLDPVVRMEILELLREFVADGEKSVLFSSHITSDLDKIADYLVMLDNGEVIENTPIDEIENRYVVVSGPNEMVEKCGIKLIGAVKGNMTFEALAERSEAVKINEFTRKMPNIENIVTYKLIEAEKKNCSK